MPLIKTPTNAPLGRASLLVATSVVGGAPLAVGAVHPPVLVAVTALALFSLALHIADRVATGRRITTTWLLLPFAIGLASALFHLVPMPLFLRTLLAPDATDMLEWIRAALPSTVQGDVRSVLTLDAAATAQSALRLIAAASVLVVIADRCRERRNRRFAFRVLLGFGAALFAVSLGHKVVNADRIYGLFEPNGRLPLFGPLINPNHLARAFGVFALLLIGRGLQVRSRTEASMFVVVGTFCAGGVFATVSRGGIAALGVAALCGTALFLWAKRSQGDEANENDDDTGEQSRLTPLLITMVAAAILIVIGVLVWDRLAFEAGREISVEGTKLKLIPVGLRLLDAHWRVGVGSGAFAFGVPDVMRVGDFNRELTVVFAENIVVETLTTHGVLVGGVLFCIALMAMVTLLKDIRPEGAFPIAAIVFLFVGELFDFAFEVGFGALLAALALGLAIGPNLDREKRKVKTKAAWIWLAVATTISAWLSYVAISEDNRAMEQRALEAKGEAREHLLFEGMARHPFNAWYPYAMAVASREKRDAKNALKWANRALNLRPTYGGAHLEAARVLWAFGKPEQAALEYRLAWENQRGTTVVPELFARTRDLALWTRATPRAQPEALSLLCERLVRDRPADETAASKDQRLAASQACFFRAANAEGASMVVKRRALDVAIARNDIEAAKEILETIGRELAPETRAEILVRLTASDQGPAAARAQAQAFLVELRTPTPILHWLLQDAKRNRDYATIHGTVSQLRHHTTSLKDREKLDLVEIDTWMAEGETTKGMRLLSKLVRRRPRDLNLLNRMGHIQAQLGMIADARRTAKKALRIDPKNRQAMEALKKLTTSPPSNAVDAGFPQ